jgi:hypothetical protein
VGIDPLETHTFSQTILLPEPKRRGKKAKTRSSPEMVKRPVLNGKGSRSPSASPSLKKEKPHHSPQPDKSRRETDSSGPAAQEAKLMRRREYERARSKSPERMEYNRRLAQEQRQKAKELGKCRNCSEPAILHQTRCPACAEAHRQSSRLSDARRRAMDRGMESAEEWSTPSPM